MVGLEKVTNKIIASAEADAARILAEADAECAAVLAAAEENAAKLRVAAEDAADTESASVVSRARAAAETERRGILLAGRCRAIDAAFSAAEKKICGMPSENYLGFLVALAREASAGQSGECVVTLNRSDRVSFGRTLIEHMKASGDGIDWQLSDGEARISGGLWLDFGETRVDCSVAALIAEARPSLEADVCRALFGGGEVKND